jgi:NAD+ synthase (glutamine-hydrolysing)
MRVYICQINSTVGDIKGNTKKIICSLQKAREQHAEIVVFPETAICGYPAEDLLLFSSFIDEINFNLKKIIENTKDLFVVVGTVRENLNKKGKKLFNSAAIICDCNLLGYKDKTLLPTYDVFNETRYFEPGEKQKVWEYKKNKIGVLICEDLWMHSKNTSLPVYKRDPVEELKELHPDIVINIAASPYYFQKKDVRFEIYRAAATGLRCPLICCNQVGANDQLVFDGNSLVLNRKGEIIAFAKTFEEDYLLVETKDSINTCVIKEDPIAGLFKALVLGVKDYFNKIGFKKACVGLSGGIDSAVVACIAIEALGKENLLLINMPSRFSSREGIEDAKNLCENLNIKLKDISIDSIFQAYLDLLSPIFDKRPFDTTEENLQARIRGMILMAISNKLGYIVLSTGNKSEMAVGYSTLYGDMCGGLGVLVDVSKTLVYQLARWINKEKEIIPISIIEKEPSAELRENQKDIDTLPDYSIVDTILNEYVESHIPEEEIIKKHKLPKNIVDDLVLRLHLAEYKRRQSPPGIRVTKKSFSKGRYFPIVQGWVKPRKKT